MDKEKLITAIMEDYAKAGEPISREDAEEVAEMEIKAGTMKRYAQAEPTKKKERKPRERKIDTDKQYLLKKIGHFLSYEVAEIKTLTIKTETEINFHWRGDDYTLRLIKHRPKK